ncbi:MAG: family ATPase [Rickettsiales bacterium]|jgi:magnesium chelatase family protein|nr:family ATPase [Rickettsiales bacterium]
MVARILTVAFEGVDTASVEVQVHMGSGLPAFTIVGLPDKAVAESKERIRAALHSLGLSLPPKRITVNLSPADILKEGSHYDLPITLGLLVTMEVVSPADIDDYIALGELSLDGRIIRVAGILPAAMHAFSQGRGIICPEMNGSEAAWAGDDLKIIAPNTLLTLVNHFRGNVVLPRPGLQGAYEDTTQYPDLRDIKGQETAKRALEVAAAGGHNLLMVGPPGSGKSMLAARLPGLLPPMEPEEMLEASMIASIAGLLVEGKLEQRRPFRDPHHSCSMPAMVGGGKTARPGEISLAHRGVLFLDELPEFNRNVLDSLRQSTETGKVTVSRVNSHVTYPARFQLIAAMNPCRCGYMDDPGRSCSRVPTCGTDYQSRISGPLIDRMDIRIEVPAVNILELERMERQGKAIDGTADVASRVKQARMIQKERYKSRGLRILTNAEADGELLIEVAKPDEEGNAILHQAVGTLKLSMRGYHRVLRVARTVADLEGAEQVKKRHISEALTYRQAG